MIVPKLWQWGLMIVCGVLMLLTVVVMVRLMQMVRVSVVVGVMAGILMAGTSSYVSGKEYIGVALIGIGVAMLLKT